MAVPRAHFGIENIKPHMVGASDQPTSPASILLNSNESAFGASPHAIAAARAAASSMERYVENVDSILAPAIAERYVLREEQITCGQGSDDLLQRLARGYLGPGDALLRSANGYLKAPNYAHAVDGKVINVPDDDFKPSVTHMIDAITDRTKIVYLANPENPAGTYLSGEEVRALHAAIPPDALLVLDCAYEEYVDAADYEAGHRLVDEEENVVMCRTFSKIHGLAGARIGWLYGPPDVVDTVKRLALTFPIATSSLAAALAALRDDEHVKAVRGENHRLRDWLCTEFGKLGLRVIPSQTNFVLVHLPNPQRS
ncbi:MAG: aminotransferase class I/II-fold pyridoxal phosphate-dependent enzyme, partial [Boseongicola sp.]